MNDFSSWWEGLSLSLKIYWGFAIPFTLFFVLQLLWSFIAGDHHHDSPNADTDVTGDTGIPFQFLTVKNLVTFFTIFGWAGIAALDSGLSETAAAIIATGSGILMMLVMATVFYMLAKASADGTMKFEKAVGHSCEVYLVIPRNRKGMGKVQIKIQKSLRTLEAITDDEQDIATNSIVKVTGIVNENVLLVTAK
jgi:hypothetical protein